MNTHEFLQNAPANEVIDWLQAPRAFDPNSESYEAELLSIIIGLLRRQVILEARLNLAESRARQAANLASCLANGVIPD